jgi:DNA polymerase III epsilon subunit-like protein
MSKHIMLDLETLGNGNNAAIVSIGAYYFDTNDPDNGEEYYVLVDPKTSVSYGQVMDASAVLWWMEQENDARQELVKAGKEGLNLSTALLDFSRWYITMKNKSGKTSLPVWGNGATFDNVIISSAYKSAGIDKPWFYRSDYCYRTLANLCQSVRKNEMEGTIHNALDDAKIQAKHLAAILKKLNLD